MKTSYQTFVKKHLTAPLLTLLCICIAVMGQCQVFASGEPPMSWYCPRGKNHAQPHFGSDLSVVESYGGYFIDHKHTSADSDSATDKVVYLTFDAGYENGNVAKILDTLKAKSVTGAFFILGHLCEAYPDLVQRMADEGHLVCNHTYTHKNMTGTGDGTLTEELHRMESACDALGVTMSKYFRPPEGRFDRAMLQEAQKCGYKTIFWSFAYADWDNQKQPNPTAAKEKILQNIHNGAVILLHPTSATNATILGDVIDTLLFQGYRFGTLDELTEG